MRTHTSAGRWLACLLMLWAPSLGSGCIVVNGWVTEKVWTETTERYELPVKGVTGVECRTHNGRVSVKAEAAPEAPVLVTAHVKAGGSDLDDATQCLEAVQLTVEKVNGRITAHWRWREEKRRSWKAQVDFEIFQPPLLPLTAHSHNGAISVLGVEVGGNVETHNGRITLERCSGAWRAKTHNGRIAVSGYPDKVALKTHNGRIQADLYTSGQLGGTIVTHNGSVRVSLPDSASTRVNCSTHNGGIRSSRGFYNIERGRRYFRGSVGEAGSTLAIETHNGSIFLGKSAASF